MLPVYKFYLQGVQAFPVIGNAVAIDFKLESEQKFFRKKWSGKLTFIGADYTTIVSSSISTKFTLRVDMAYNASTETIFEGHFYKTDCEIDEDAKTVVVTPSPDDEYNGILEGLEKEFNLVQLAPAVVKLTAAKRPIFQLYRSGNGYVTNILSGMYWEQECDVKTWNEIESGDFQFDAVSGYIQEYNLSGNGSWQGVISEVFFSESSSSTTFADVTKGGYRLSPASVLGDYAITIYDSNNTILWRGFRSISDGKFGVYNMSPVNGESGTLEILLEQTRVYCRILCDVDSIGGVSTHNIPADDFIENSLNYHKVLGYQPGDVIVLRDDLSSTPTEWGQTDSGMYFVKPVFPEVLGIGDVLPVCPSTWIGVTIWWTGTPLDWTFEEDGRKEFTLNDAFPLWSVISVLLNKINAGVSFADSASYSRFLYGDGGNIRPTDYRLFITPKSNIVSAEYDEAAQRGNISLKQVFDMLRDCFRCYWFIDSGKLRIEHIEYFRMGGSYSTTPSVGVDLTTLKYTRTNKPLADGQSAYKYDKPETYGRIEFGWMDDVTEQFNGYPIDIISDFVEQGRVERKDISQFTSDLDYVLLNPTAVSKDGFMLLCAKQVGGEWKIPFVNYGENDKYVLQNGYMSFLLLADYYLYDLPAPDYEIDGVSGTAIGTMPLKTQEINFPHTWIPDLVKLVKTNLGDGQIKRLSFELLSMNCKATLNYGTT